MTTMADKMKEAEVKKETQTKKAIVKQAQGGKLPDLGAIEVVELSEEELARQAEEAQKRQEWVEDAARKTVAIQKTVSEITVLGAKCPLSSESNSLLTSGKNALEKIRMMIGSAGCTDHFKKAVFLESIRKADDTAVSVEFFLGGAVGAGHYRVVTDLEAKNLGKRGSTWPKGTLRFHGEFYLSCYEEMGDKSGHQKALEAELGKLIRRTVATEKKAVQERLAELERNPIGDPLDFKDRQLGTYSFFFPAGENKEAGRKWQAGAIVVEIKDKTMGRKDNRFTIQVIEIAEALFTAS